jgi:hypothetical protein
MPEKIRVITKDNKLTCELPQGMGGDEYRTWKEKYQHVLDEAKQQPNGHVTEIPR